MFDLNRFNVSPLENLMLSLTPASCVDLEHYVIEGLSIDVIVALLEDDINQKHPQSVWVNPTFEEEWEHYIEATSEPRYYLDDAEEFAAHFDVYYNEEEQAITDKWNLEDDADRFMESEGRPALHNAHVHAFLGYTLSISGCPF